MHRDAAADLYHARLAEDEYQIESDVVAQRDISRILKGECAQGSAGSAPSTARSSSMLAAVRAVEARECCRLMSRRHLALFLRLFLEMTRILEILDKRPARLPDPFSWPLWGHLLSYFGLACSCHIRKADFGVPASPTGLWQWTTGTW